MVEADALGATLAVAVVVAVGVGVGVAVGDGATLVDGDALGVGRPRAVFTAAAISS